MDNPYANIVYPADLEDLAKAFSALAQVHIRHALDDSSYDCQHCPCVCTEPCFCVYQSVKVAYENALNNSNQLKTNNEKQKMTKPKFTPGPWHVEDNGLCVCDSNRVVLFLSDRPYGNETDRADANLIAAAPEMYEALQKIASMTPGTSCDTDDGCSYYESECGTCYEMIGIAQDALRKARGESEVEG